MILPKLAKNCKILLKLASFIEILFNQLQAQGS